MTVKVNKLNCKGLSIKYVRSFYYIWDPPPLVRTLFGQIYSTKFTQPALLRTLLGLLTLPLGVYVINGCP